MSSQARSDPVPPAVLAPRSPEEINADARRTIAYILIVSYVVLVIANVAVPVLLYLTSRPAGPFTMDDVRDLTSAITGILTGLVGILGFVVGYYFKALDDTQTPPQRRRK